MRVELAVMVRSLPMIVSPAAAGLPMEEDLGFCGPGERLSSDVARDVGGAVLGDGGQNGPDQGSTQIAVVVAATSDVTPVRTSHVRSLPRNLTLTR